LGLCVSACGLTSTMLRMRNVHCYGLRVTFTGNFQHFSPLAALAIKV